MYNEKVLDHFSNPRNAGEIKDADGVGQTGNPADGDNIIIYIKVNNGILTDVRFKTFGCGAAIAASSMLTELAIGKTLDDALKITNEDVAEALGGLPPQKLVCSNIAADALHNAIKDYLKRKDQNLAKNELSSESVSHKTEATQTHKLNNEQIKRYLRHIIMPEISGAGQQKLLESSVLICAPSINACDTVLLYMAASGIGNIYCYMEDIKEDTDLLLLHVRDLNPDVKIELLHSIDNLKFKLSMLDNPIDYNIIIGDLDFINRVNRSILSLFTDKLPPTLLAAGYSWHGYIKLCLDEESIGEFLSDIYKKRNDSYYTSNDSSYYKLGSILSYAFIGPLTVIEAIKSRLSIGSLLKDMLYFDLLNMSFDKSEDIISNITFDSIDIHEKLSKCKALIIGTGGLGSPAAFILAKSGLGTIGLVDFDHVEISNLNRQVLHSTSRIGMLKVESAKQTLNNLYPDVNILIHPETFSSGNSLELVNSFDIVIDGLDNFPTRYLLNDSCYFADKTLIEAGVLSFFGQTTTIVPNNTACLRCIFPESTRPTHVPSCSEAGVLGPVPGLIGTIEAIQAIKYLLGVGLSTAGEFLMYNALEASFTVIEVERNDLCALCGKNPEIKDIKDYTFVCEDKKS